MKQLSLFSAKSSLDDSIKLTIEKLNYHIKPTDHVVVSFSGGKDSTTVVTLLAHLLETNQIVQPQSVTVVYADTRMELPPLHQSAMQLLSVCRNKNIATKIATAEIDKRFLVYILGRGVPPPNNTTMRWCTDKIKVQPMMHAIDDIRQTLAPNERILMLTGVRVGESAVRDHRIVMSCSKNGAECGQGWFQQSTGDRTDTLAPIDHWRVCHVWDWLMFHAPALNFDTGLLASVYGGDEATEINARTGCIGCPLAQEDTALLYLTKQPGFNYLVPLLGLKPLYREMREFRHRLQKAKPEILKDGSLGKNPNRKGPLKLESRRYFLQAILDIQNRCNQIAGYQAVDLLNQVEVDRINELIDANTWPQKWDGTEVGGEMLTDQYYADGSIQPLLWTMFS